MLGRLYACFILTFSVGAGLAARETSQRGRRDFLSASLGLTLLVLLASVLHLDRFKAAPVTTIWFAAFSLAALTFAVGPVVQLRPTVRPRTPPPRARLPAETDIRPL